MRKEIEAERGPLSVSRAAELLGLRKTDSLLADIRSGRLVAYRVGDGEKRPTFRIDPADLLTWLDSRKVVPVEGVKSGKTAKRREMAGVTRYF